MLMMASMVAKLISEVIAPVQLLDTLLAVASIDSCWLAVLLVREMLADAKMMMMMIKMMSIKRTT